jgi:DNA-binding MurR/RpiR family transcriptional regulator
MRVFANRMNGPHDTLITDRFPKLAPQLQKAARWILDHPQEVALLSMRDQARLADVAPATMTRLAQALGLDGFDVLRAAHAKTLRAASTGLATQAAPQLANGDKGHETISSVAGHLAAMDNPQTHAALDNAADIVAQAGRVYCLGLRASHGAAWHLHYALSLVRTGSVFLDGLGATGLDSLADAGAGDVLIVVGVRPYARPVVIAAQQARERGLGVIAITDSRVSPLCAPSDPATIVVPTRAPGFLHAMTPAFAIAEALAAGVGARLGSSALARLRMLDPYLGAFDTYLAPEPRRHP